MPKGAEFWGWNVQMLKSPKQFFLPDKTQIQILYHDSLVIQSLISSVANTISQIIEIFSLICSFSKQQQQKQTNLNNGQNCEWIISVFTGESYTQF